MKRYYIKTWVWLFWRSACKYRFHNQCYLVKGFCFIFINLNDKIIIKAHWVRTPILKKNQTVQCTNIKFIFFYRINLPVQGTPRNGCGKRCQRPDFRPECLTPTCPLPLATPGHLCWGEGRQIRHVGSTRGCCGQRKRTFHLLHSFSRRCGDHDLGMLVVRCRKMRNCKNRRREPRRFRVLGRMRFLC